MSYSLNFLIYSHFPSRFLLFHFYVPLFFLNAGRCGCPAAAPVTFAFTIHLRCGKAVFNALLSLIVSLHKYGAMMEWYKEKSLSPWRKTWPRAILLTTSAIWFALRLNMNRRGDKPSANSVSHGTARVFPPLFAYESPVLFLRSLYFSTTDQYHTAPLLQQSFSNFSVQSCNYIHHLL